MSAPGQPTPQQSAIASLGGTSKPLSGTDGLGFQVKGGIVQQKDAEATALPKEVSAATINEQNRKKYGTQW